MPLKIVVAQSGWVFVGEYAEDDAKITLTNAQNIRQWGTTKGLGELALKGPTNQTQLDPYGVVHILKSAVLLTIESNGESWSHD